MTSGTRKLRLVDVGGAGGLQPCWARHADLIAPVMFEPNPVEAAKLRESLAASFAEAVVVEAGLSNVTGEQSLNIARFWGCTSLRRPNPAVLGRYRIGPLFEVTARAPVFCTRYDELHAEGRVPAPDAVKIDVQGYEHEVLQGFGGLLQGCLGIELETHVYPVYQDQKLLGDLIALLEPYGFVLRRLSPVPSFDGDVVELDAWFTKNIDRWRRLDEAGRGRFRTICDAWGLIDYSRIDPASTHLQLSAP